MIKLLLRNTLVFLVGIFAFPLFSQEQIDRSKAPINSNPPKINLGKTQSFELKNGLKVLVVENHKLPILSVSLELDYSPVLLENKAGLQSLFSEMLKSGTKKYTKAQLDEKLEELATDLYASSHGAYLSTLSKNTAKSIELLSQVVLYPTFDNHKEFEKFVKQKITLLEASEKNPDAIQSRVENVLYYGKNHPLGQYITLESLKNIKLKDLKNYHKAYFKPNMAYLAFVGDITKKEAIKLAKKYFSKWKGTRPSFKKYPTAEKSNQTEIYLVDLPDVSQAFISVGGLSEFKLSNEDYLAGKMANKILGGEMSGKLDQNIREKNGYAYYARSELSPNKYYKGNFSAFSQVRTEVTDKAVVEFIKEIKNISKTPVDEKELINHKKEMIGNFALSLESPEAIANLTISKLINGLPKDFYSTYLQNIQNLNSQEVLNAAQKYIPAKEAKILIIGNQKKILPGLQKLGYPIKFLNKWGDLILSQKR